MELEPIACLHPQFDPALGLLRLALDHGKANEIGTVQLAAFEALCDLVEQQPAIACIVTTSRRRSSKGTALFIAGANVAERMGWTAERVAGHVQRQRELMLRLRGLPVFTIALSGGATLGWGLEYCLACDYVVATDEAIFGLPETGLGIVPGAGGTAWLAARIGVAQALRLGCTGERLDADQARAIGLVDERVPDVEQGLTRARALATMLAERSPTAVAAFKRAVVEGVGLPIRDRLTLEAAAYEHTLATGEAELGRAAFGTDARPRWGARR